MTANATPDTDTDDAPTAAVMNIMDDGSYETFEPEWAAAMMRDSEREGEMEMSDNHLVCTVTGVDALGREVELEYSLSQIVASVAHYDDPDNATFTTAPDDVERIAVYGQDDYNPDAITLTNGPFSLPDGVKKLYDHCDYADFEEDYFLVHGMDNADPVPNEYDAYYILTRATCDGREFFRHERATQAAMMESMLEARDAAHDN